MAPTLSSLILADCEKSFVQIHENIVIFKFASGVDSVMQRLIKRPLKNVKLRIWWIINVKSDMCLSENVNISQNSISFEYKERQKLWPNRVSNR